MNQETAHLVKKVVYLITKATSGGAQRYVWDLMTHLPADYRPALLFGEEGRLAVRAKAHEISIRQIPALTRDLSVVADVLSMIGIIRNLRDARADVLHLNSSKAALFGAIAGRIVGTRKIIFTVHGWPFKEERFFLSRIFIYMASWLTALLSHEVIVVSRGDELLAKRMLGMRNKVSYIPLAREPLEFASAHEGFVKMFGTLTPPVIGSNTLRLVTIAELTHNKGIRYCVEAVKHLTDRGIDCIYVVPSDGEEREVLEKLVRKLGVQDRVFFPGYVEDAAHYLSGFDVCVLPSIKEGMPYVVIEAAAAGLPIVATTALDHDLQTEIPHMKLVPARNSLLLADAIGEIAKTPRNPNAGFTRSFDAMIRDTVVLYR